MLGSKKSFWLRPWSYASAKSNHPREPQLKEELPTGCALLRPVAASKRTLKNDDFWRPGKPGNICAREKKCAWKCHSHRSSTGLCPWNQVWMQQNLEWLAWIPIRTCELVQPTYFSSPWWDQSNSIESLRCVMPLPVFDTKASKQRIKQVAMSSEPPVPFYFCCCPETARMVSMSWSIVLAAVWAPLLAKSSATLQVNGSYKIRIEQNTTYPTWKWWDGTF